MKVTGKELARILELSPSTVRGYAQRGIIPFETTPGGHRRYAPEEVKKALQEVRASIAPLEPGEGPRLASAADAGPDFELAPRWRPAITTAMLHDDVAPAPASGPLRVPVIGIPGSSQFAVGQGARA